MIKLYLFSHPPHKRHKSTNSYTTITTKQLEYHGVWMINPQAQEMSLFGLSVSCPGNSAAAGLNPIIVCWTPSWGLPTMMTLTQQALHKDLWT